MSDTTKWRTIGFQDTSGKPAGIAVFAPLMKVGIPAFTFEVEDKAKADELCELLNTTPHMHHWAPITVRMARPEDVHGKTD